MPKSKTYEPWNIEKARALSEQRACQCWLLLSETEAAQLLQGTVPEVLTPQLRTLADWIAKPHEETA
jgi:hypothetical protein